MVKESKRKKKKKEPGKDTDLFYLNSKDLKSLTYWNYKGMLSIIWNSTNNYKQSVIFSCQIY